jgi:carbon monoxide dehydrogenase subunit G
MEFDGEFSVATGPAETWEFMLDPEQVGSCIPNCQSIEVIDDTHYTAEIGVSVSHISMTFDVNAEIVEQREEEYLNFTLAGDAKDGDSRMEADVEIEMAAGEDETTDIEWENTVDVTGRVMNMGSRIVKRVGMRQTNKTIDNFQDELGEPESEAEETGGLLS